MLISFAINAVFVRFWYDVRISIFNLSWTSYRWSWCILVKQQQHALKSISELACWRSTVVSSCQCTILLLFLNVLYFTICLSMPLSIYVFRFIFQLYAFSGNQLAQESRKLWSNGKEWNWWWPGLFAYNVSCIRRVDRVKYLGNWGVVGDGSALQQLIASGHESCHCWRKMFEKMWGKTGKTCMFPVTNSLNCS